MSARRAPLVFAAAGASALLARIVLSGPPGPPAPAGPPYPALPPEGAFSFDVRDADTGVPVPCRLVFIGVEGSPNPAFTRTDIGRQEGDAVAAFNRVFSLSGAGVLRVPYGTFDVTVARGPEWEAFTARRVKVGPQGAHVDARIRHVVDTAGWLSVDLHVHAAPSSDSTVPMKHRVAQFVADGVEMIVSTDHNVVSSYAPAIEELGVGRYLASARGDELTTNGWGHFGAFPLPQEMVRAGGGAILVHGRVPSDFFREVRAVDPGALIDVHHPRLDDVIGYFNLGRFDARLDRAERPGFSFDFDAVEVLNGYQDPVRRSVDRVIDDWFALLNHGHLVAATGNSDTHHLTFNLGGYPRNYVRVPDDRPAAADPLLVARAVKERRCFFTTGPFVRVTAGSGLASGTMGDVVAAPGGRARIQIEVQAPSWIAVDRVTLYVNGQETRRWAVPASSSALRFRESIEIDVARDSWAVVRVDGDKLMAPAVGDTKTFPVQPLALTNPVFLDADGDGRYTPLAPHGDHAPAPLRPDPRRPTGSGRDQSPAPPSPPGASGQAPASPSRWQ